MLSVVGLFPFFGPSHLLLLLYCTFELMTAPDCPSRGNTLVDHLASDAHSSPIRPPPAPLPTLFMDKLTPYVRSRHSFTRAPSFVVSLPFVFRPLLYLILLLTSLLHDSRLPPAHPYICASYSAVIQLYDCSLQPPTSATLASWFGEFGPPSAVSVATPGKIQVTSS